MNDKITIGRCKDCKWRDKDGNCTNNEKLHEDDYRKAGTDDHLVYPYYESGDFYVGPSFGCVHWTNNKVTNFGAEKTQ